MRVTTRRACNEPRRRDRDPGGGHASDQAIAVGQGWRRHPVPAGQIPGMTPRRGQPIQESRRAPGYQHQPCQPAPGRPLRTLTDGSHAVFLADLARLWVERDDPEVRDDREEMDLVAAIALRTTTSFAGSQLRDAHLALPDLPRTYAQLAAGVMPVEWFTRLVVAVRALTQVQRDQVDQRVATWQLASIPAESFRRHLKTLIAWFTAEQKPTCPQELRDVTFEPSPAEDGTACVRLIGPIPELVSFTRRLDQSARAVQNQQRHALAEGAAVPFDLDGQAQADGRPLSLAALRYAILTRTELETGPVEVPAERFMINVVVPAMTLMGYCDAPALLDGITPVPAPMARWACPQVVDS